MKKLSTKIWTVIVAFLAITILFMYVLTDFLYEGLYVKDAEDSMVEVGEKLSTIYNGGKVTDEFIQKIDEYNDYSNINVFAVRNPRELSACVPFDIDYDTLIGADERQQLLEGKTITKKGYEKRFDRQVISAIIPLTDQKRLEGIIYIYFPLAKITEMASKEVFILLGSAAIFIVLIGFGVFKGIKHIMKPLKELQNAAEKMAVGNYETRVEVKSKDEIGELAQTFNKMATSIQREDEAQKQFLATVSHELRTPISYVKGYGEALQNGYIEESQRQETLSLIVREANRLEKLTNELLQLSRAVNQTESGPLYPLPLAETLREVVTITEQKAYLKSISLRTDIDEDIIINANEEKIKQIMINLIENGLRYSKEGTEIILSSKRKENMAIITVQDHGIGIPAEDLPHITERFYRVNKARSRSDGGSGLGLSIVDQLVKYHKGTWHIDSELGNGTKVTIQIPLIKEI
ncbi:MULTISPECIES: cell wall metabolism sensor histidine kinase WalK [unclassified Rummeliibacillus]|uniref:sensor histidine kinase n=1 Tax=unclassified Rummeliibacillus TaxID=2622809 RepID=UPI000E66210A|nr:MULTISPECIES: HAMP domain-containing sensor histidine kinase [unclassified Rummeliibacillus]RIJ67925.1 sensor histidine kinase [Rummeliibacillus sp. POC4]RPJ95776.1 sensor histidine kinase [Rummeliibacillus sp. TYF005]